jgi:uncharacterized membrane protein
MVPANPPTPDAEPPVFSAVLRPYRSLGPRGFLALMATMCAISFITGLIFWLAGAWPVIGFMGLDVALVYVAFRLNYRDARAAEEISLTRSSLIVRRIAADGETSVIELNPYWARLEVDRRPGIGVTRVGLTSHGRRFSIGAFLGPDERETLAVKLAAALAKARATPAA